MNPDPNDALSELQTLLMAVEPSRAFVPGIRARFEMTPSRQQVGWFPWLGLGVGLAAVGVLLTVALRTPPRTSRPVVPPTERLASAQVPSVPLTSDAARTAPAPVAEQNSARLLAPVVGQLDGHDVLVPADQFLMVARLVGTGREGQVGLPAALVAIYDQDGLLLAPAPLVLTPLPALVAVDIDEQGNASAPKTDRKDKP